MLPLLTGFRPQNWRILAGEFLDNRFGLALRSALSIEARTEGIDDGDEIGQQVVAPILG
jgi:hypothetical protein